MNDPIYTRMHMISLYLHNLFVLLYVLSFSLLEYIRQLHSEHRMAQTLEELTLSRR